MMAVGVDAFFEMDAAFVFADATGRVWRCGAPAG